MSKRAGKPRRWNWWSLAGVGLTLSGLASIVARLDLAELRTTILEADPLFLAMMPVAIITEQLVRAWKWRQILHPLRSIGTLRLFGAIMAGYLASLLVPVGLSPLVRSWLVARLEALTMSAVLASVAIDRLIDGVVFAGLVLFLAVFAAFPDSNGEIRSGLVVAGTGTLGAIIAAFLLLWHHKRATADGMGWILRAAERLSPRFAKRTRALELSFADGIVWPTETWRRAAIVAASFLIKLIAASQLLWAGLAFGVLLSPVAYLVLLAILGFTVILAQLARVPGGFIVGAVFALGLFGVGKEQALAMVTAVLASGLLAIGGVGGFALWRHGIGLDELKTQQVPSDGPA